MHMQLYFHETDLFPYEPLSPIWMIIYTLLSWLFFTILNNTIKLNKIDKSTWFKQNILLSFIHAFICSVLLVISVLRAPEIFQDPLSHANHFNYALLAFSNGYFLYDFIDCFKNSPTSATAFLIHHIIVMMFLSQVLIYTRNIGYALYGLSIEINSVFLHARRLVRWYSPTSISMYHKNLLKQFIDFGNFITFIIFRFGMVIVGLRALYFQQHRLHPILHIFTVLITSAIGVLNLVLFCRLIISQSMGRSKLKHEKKMEDNISNTNNHILLPS